MTQNTYDAAGHLLSNGTAHFTYSARGRMQTATVGDKVVSYLINGLGQRTMKSGPVTIIPSGAAYYVYDEQGRLLGEYDADGKVIEETVFLGDLPVAVVKQSTTGSGAAAVTTTTPYYIYADHLNTPQVITRVSDNRMVWRWDAADPFGMDVPDENPSGLSVFGYNPRFPGQVYDSETTLHYNYFRDYDPQTGRYVQSDPIGLGGGINTYAYVGGNPLGYTDPLGLFRSPEWMRIFIPGQVAWDNAVTAWENGDRGIAAAYTGVMFGEALGTVMMSGATSVGRRAAGGGRRFAVAVRQPQRSYLF